MIRSIAAAIAGLTLVASPVAATAAAPPTSAPPAAAGDAAATGGDVTWGVQPATADGPSSRPAFTYAVRAGAAIEDYVLVVNPSDEALTLRMYASDAVTTSEGLFDLRVAGDRSVDVGSWVTLEIPEVTIPAGGRTIVPFTLTVPANATPGDHIGGIVASLATAATGDAGSRVLVDRRVGVRIYLRVDGPLEPELEITSVSVTHRPSIDPRGGGVTVDYTVSNVGNVRLAAGQRVRVSGPFGVELGAVDAGALPELLPGNSLTRSVTLDRVFPAGSLHAEVVLTPYLDGEELDSPPAPAVAGVSTSAVPWVQLAAVALVGGLWWWRRRTRRRSGASSPPARLGGDRAGGTLDVLDEDGLDDEPLRGGVLGVAGDQREEALGGRGPG